MEKIREYKYDNLKFVLIFLVVLGHLVELINFENFNKIIYIFHMPMFIYISGYFSKCNIKGVLKKLYIFFIWQMIYYFLYRYLLNQNIEIDYIKKPIWILWYIYALIIWESIVLIIPFKEKISKKPIIIICITFVLSLISGFSSRIGYDYSLSRVITFFPFFLIGYFQKKYRLNIIEITKENQTDKYKILVFSIISVISIIYFAFNISKANIRCFYGAFSYKAMGYTICFKFMWMVLALSIMFLLNNVIPKNKIKLVSKIGSNTMPIYLIHGIIVKLIGKYGMSVFIDNRLVNLLICMIIAFIILLILGNDYISKYLSFLFNVKEIKNGKQSNN